MIYYVHGPAGCGKTRNQHRIAKALGCTRIVDELHGTPFSTRENVLAFGNQDQAGLVSPTFVNIPFAEVMKIVEQYEGDLVFHVFDGGEKK